MKNRWISAILTALLIVGLFAALLPVSALAAGGGTGITLGTGAITAGNKVYVYFGNQALWRVLGKGTGDTANKGALLISNNTLASISFNPVDAVPYPNQWQESFAQSWCIGYYINWPEGIEKNAILATSVSETGDYTSREIGNHGGNTYGAASLINEYFFFLSAKEADELFSSDDDRKASGESTYWWLRSPYDPRRDGLLRCD